MNRRNFLAAALAAPAFGCSSGGVKLDAPYVPTPWEVAREMLRLAAVTSKDLVYDLGCGDGRIVITAAQEFGARGVGIDIDPRRIAEANALAREVGVQDRVRFVVQDLFETDFSDASVVALYLYPRLNERLKPKFLGGLKPGTRIVSHQYGIGDWRPETSIDVDVDGRSHKVLLWRVPAR